MTAGCCGRSVRPFSPGGSDRGELGDGGFAGWRWWSSVIAAMRRARTRDDAVWSIWSCAERAAAQAPAMSPVRSRVWASSLACNAWSRWCSPSSHHARADRITNVVAYRQPSAAEATCARSRQASLHQRSVADRAVTRSLPFNSHSVSPIAERTPLVRIGRGARLRWLRTCVFDAELARSNLSSACGDAEGAREDRCDLV